MAHKILYLNDHSSLSPMRSKLLDLVMQSKQTRASSAQWRAFIVALSQKGAKQAEIDESEVLPYLDSRVGETVTLDELIAQIKSHLCVIKEVQLDKPLFARASQPGGQYAEILYIARSERGMVDDELELIEDTMASLALDPEALMEDLDKPLRLEARRKWLMSQKDKAIDFEHHHYDSLMNDELGRNLVAHTRVSIYPETGLMLINEIQSDWAQKGRRNDWRNVPRGPYVTSTEAWSGLVLKRLLQRAALDPRVKQVGWITESMRNGSSQDIAKENRDREMLQANAAAYQEALTSIRMQWAAPEMRDGLLNQLILTQDLSIATLRDIKAAPDDDNWIEQVARTMANKRCPVPRDGLNDFYLRVLPKIADKALGGVAKISRQDVQYGKPDDLKRANIPLLEISPAVRDKLRDALPTYSRDALRSIRSGDGADPKALTTAILKTERRLGSIDHIRFAAHLTDHAGESVAGKTGPDGIVVSKWALRFAEVVDHETFHFAQSHILSKAELAMLDEAFSPGRPMQQMVIHTLSLRLPPAPQLIKQCEECPRECAAQAFALWAGGLLHLDPQGKGRDTIDLRTRVADLFGRIRSACEDVSRWAVGLVRSGQASAEATTPVQDPRTPRRIAALFAALDTGALATRARAAAERPQG